MKEKLKERLIILNTMFNIFLLFGFFIGGFVWADTNGVWDRAQDIVAGTFGADQGNGTFIFPDNLTVNKNLNVKNNVNVSNNICLGNDCYNNWAQVCSDWVNESAVN